MTEPGTLAHLHICTSFIGTGKTLCATLPAGAAMRRHRPPNGFSILELCWALCHENRPFPFLLSQSCSSLEGLGVPDPGLPTGSRLRIGMILYCGPSSTRRLSSHLPCPDLSQWLTLKRAVCRLGFACNYHLHDGLAKPIAKRMRGSCQTTGPGRGNNEAAPCPPTTDRRPPAAYFPRYLNSGSRLCTPQPILNPNCHPMRSPEVHKSPEISESRHHITHCIADSAKLTSIQLEARHRLTLNSRP